ncbi:MAG: hypothetical protein SGILL_001555 [Bacillariaceae sp.]
MDWTWAASTAPSEQPTPTPSSSDHQKKRRHPNSADQTGDHARPLTSTEILQLVENPNFEELARQHPTFRQAWEETRARQKEKGPHTSFSSCVTQEFTIALTRALLQTYFRLKLPYLEEDHLCPPIPNRFFYLHWIQSELLQHIHGTNKPTHGLDIGAGASCIYSLLAARFYRCKMTTSEIDPKALQLAGSNVKANHLSNFINILEVEPSHAQQGQWNVGSFAQLGGPLCRAIEAVQQNQSTKTQSLDFVMTNPPFYDPKEQAHNTHRVGDGRARTNMTVSEGTYPGGEVGFVIDMIADSLHLMSSSSSSSSSNNNHNTLIHSKTWFSSMLGKKTSLVKLQKLLVHLMGPAHVKVAEYGPGQYTRWFLSWTLKQPCAVSSLAKLPPHDQDSFQISLMTLREQTSSEELSNAMDTVADGMNEIVKRIVAYCQLSPGGWELAPYEQSQEEEASTVMVRIQEEMPPAVSSYVDETQSDLELPKVILDALQRHEHHFLPDEGHFLIQLCMRPDKGDKGDHVINVQLDSNIMIK